MIKFVIQFDGVVTDVGEALYAAHVAATSAVGWSRMDPQRFRQLLRTKGSQANFLPGAKPLKSKEYQAEFERQTDHPQIIERYQPAAGLMESMRRLQRAGSVSYVTLGRNVDARLEKLHLTLPTAAKDQQDLVLTSLNADPRRRPGELAAIAGDPRRTVVLASSDSLIRSAGAADLVAVGVAGGDCSVKRLQQAGADLSYRALSDFTDDLADGGADLARVGLFLGATG